jgi:hypothetical protein
MGQKVTASKFSCVDCGSRVMTVEDNEPSCKFRPRDLLFFESSDESNDEVTVFESPLRNVLGRSQRFRAEGSAGAAGGKEDQHQRFVASLPVRSKAVRINACNKTQEESLLSETSTPTCVNNSSASVASRCKTYSRNVTKASHNLVDSIRKRELENQL